MHKKYLFHQSNSIKFGKTGKFLTFFPLFALFYLLNFTIHHIFIIFESRNGRYGQEERSGLK